MDGCVFFFSLLFLLLSLLNKAKPPGDDFKDQKAKFADSSSNSHQQATALRVAGENIKRANLRVSLLCSLYLHGVFFFFFCSNSFVFVVCILPTLIAC
ncbi:hypothetical protein V8C44DRAFT_43081 [Trichoderma aethiopicum]